MRLPGILTNASFRNALDGLLPHASALLSPKIWQGGWQAPWKVFHTMHAVPLMRMNLFTCHYQQPQESFTIAHLHHG